MTAIRRDIVIEQGADFELELDLPAGLDVEDLELAMDIRTAYGDPTSLLRLTTANGRLVVNTSTRKVMLLIAAGIAAAFYPANYVYDIKSKESDGTISRLYRGMAAVTAEVTTFDFDEEMAAALLYHGGGYIVQHGGGRILLRI